MSSGEADSINSNGLKTFVMPSTLPATSYTDYTGITTNTLTLGPVYYYQVTCPKCNHLNWAEVDKVFACKGILSQERRPNGNKTYCGATIKAVLKVADYEIAVVKP